MISEEQVRHVANLARLGLTDDEIEKMGGQLDAILDSIEKIQELDLSGVPPTANRSTSRTSYAPTSRAPSSRRNRRSPGSRACRRSVRRPQDRLRCRIAC